MKRDEVKKAKRRSQVAQAVQRARAKKREAGLVLLQLWVPAAEVQRARAMGLRAQVVWGETNANLDDVDPDDLAQADANLGLLPD